MSSDRIETKKSKGARGADKSSKKRKRAQTTLTPAERYDLSYTQNRELSWLRFDERVLEEAFDESVPLFERLKFVSIFESNLDEFFMIRIGGLSDLAELKQQPRDNKSNLTPAEQIDRVLAALPPMLDRASAAWQHIEQQLASFGMKRFEAATLAGSARTFVEAYFKSYISPIISPLVIDPRHPFPNLRNNALYVVCALEGRDETGLLGLIEVPASLPRVVQIPTKEQGFHYILLEDIITSCLTGCFGVYQPIDHAIIRVTRNADIDPDGEGVEEEEDYRQHMKRILKKRLRLQPVRLVVRGQLERATLKLIRRSLELGSRSVFTSDIPIDLGFVFSLEARLPENQRKELLFEPVKPQPSPAFDPKRPIRDQVIEGDKLLFYPYETMGHLLDLVHQAASDPQCLSIRITLYRVAKQSRLCESLIAAAEDGKEVTVLMELRARFDEENNIEWAERLEEAGCTVIYGSEGFKCHSKICQITYRENMALTRITLLGTGNFNEKTAKLYSDFMLMTAHPGIGEDANSFFRNLALGNLRGNYRYLGVAPAGLKPLIMTGLNREIERAKAGLAARVFFKLNSLTDREVIDKISEASRAGVKVEMIIRGISCLLPGIPGKTENVHIRNIVGRFLEHARVYAFGEDYDTVYLSSADMMTRNTEHRVEIAYPVLDPQIRAQVLEYMEDQLRDNVKARKLNCKGLWTKIKLREGEQPFNSQEHLLAWAYERAEEHAQSQLQQAVARPRVSGGASPTPANAPVAENLSHQQESLANWNACQNAPAKQVENTPQNDPMAVYDHETAAAACKTPALHAEPTATSQPVRASEPDAQNTLWMENKKPCDDTLTDAPDKPQTLQATVIEHDADQTKNGQQAATGSASPSQPAPTRALATRHRSRVGTGLALIGIGIKTLLFGDRQNGHKRS